jgi:hypothetical protein
MIRCQPTAIAYDALLGASICSPESIGREPCGIPHIDRAEPDVVQAGDSCGTPGAITESGVLACTNKAIRNFQHSASYAQCCLS